MPTWPNAPSDPDEGSGSEPGGGGGSSTIGSASKTGSPAQRQVLNLYQTQFQNLLREHGFPLVGSPNFSVGELAVQNVLCYETMAGLATMASGAATISAPNITASSLIFLTIQEAQDPGVVYVETKTPGTGFTISSTSPTDASVVAWIFVDSG